MIHTGQDKNDFEHKTLINFLCIILWTLLLCFKKYAKVEVSGPEVINLFFEHEISTTHKN